ncbi:MAG: hypothetical protein CL393_09735 [Acidiferrobacteraceae bacterium]|nr:hypothetical protein [Acidiferrobacteraceae bacterium]|tara:strand:+ start:9554 stop:11149 length:1596 start_codon:yes stop_codon:yes gene_type:complete
MEPQKHLFRLQISSLYFFILILIFLFLLSCNQKSNPLTTKNPIVATIGNYNITVDEFKMSFELGFSPLKMSKNPKRFYLNHMINETLLALEGTRLGYHTNPYVQKRVNQRNYSNLLEAFYISNVYGKVNISEEDIQDAIKKSTVKWRMLIWPTSSIHSAERAYKNAQQTSLVDFVKKELDKSEFKIKTLKDYETDWIDYLDIHPNYLKTISELEIGIVSKPISYGNGYALFQILNINREGILENELKFGARRKRIIARLHNIQADSISHTLMDSILTPMEIKVKGTVLEDLADALYQWTKDGLPTKGDIVSHVEKITNNSKSYLKQLNYLLDKTLISSNEWKKTVKNYLEYMNYYRRELKENNQTLESFRIVLITEIGRMIKNDTYVNIALSDSINDATKMSTDLKRWEMKWIYDIYRHNLVKDLKVSSDEMKTYFSTRWNELNIADVDTTRFYKYEKDVYNVVLYEKHNQVIENKLYELRNIYPIWINNELLDTLTLSDSYKDIQTSLLVRKSFTGEQAVPTVDLQWISF